MLANIFGLAIALIFMLSVGGMGVMQIAIGEHPVLGWTLALIGLPLTVLCVVRIVRLDRQYQDEHLAAVLRDPEQIVARWRIGDEEVILARRGLFVGRAFTTFADVHQRLTAIAITPDERTLIVQVRNVGVRGIRTREVAITPEVVPAIREFIAVLAAYFEGRDAGQR